MPSSKKFMKFPNRRAKALVTFAATTSLLAMVSTGLAFRPAGAAAVAWNAVWPTGADDGAATIAKLGIDARFHSETDAIGLADLRWEFPRLAAAQLEVGDTLTFALPGARTIDLVLIDRDWVAFDALGLSFSDVSSGSSAEIVIAGGLVSGTVRANLKDGREQWSIASGIDHAGLAGDYYARIDGIDAASQLTPIEPPAELLGGGDGGVAGDGCDDSGAVIDVLFAYTPGFLNDYPDVDAMKVAVLADLQRMNLAQVNSLSAPKFASVGFFGIAENGTGSIADDLLRIANPSDGWADGVHAERDLTRADIVVLYTDSENGSVAFTGVGNQALGFGAVGTQGGFALARALATCMGCCDAVGDSTPACSGAFAFSNAFRFTINGTTYRTLMARAPGEEIPYFSNPAVDYLGEATGSSTANNARSMSLTANTVAQYRCSIGPIEPDCDGDGILDSLAIANGIVPDCNRTGIPDSCDIALGISQDANNDGIPDECPLVDAQILPGTVGVLDTFGTSVSISTRAGDPVALLAAGAPGNDVGASNAGAAWVIPMTAGVPNVAAAQALRASDPQANAFLGRSVSAFKRPANASPAYPARNYAAVGAFRWNQSAGTGNYESKGAIYLFEEDGLGNWAQTITTTTGVPWRYSPPATGGSGAGAYSLFGYSISMGRSPTESGETIIVGAPGRNSGQGGVYVVRNQAGNAPTLHVLRTLTSPVAGDEFGHSVALAQRIPTTGNARVGFVAGAPGRNGGKGAAIVFERPVSSSSLGTWAAPLTLNPQGTTILEGDRLGTAVAIATRATTPVTGPTALVAVGAPGDDGGKGRVYFWERGTGTGLTTAWTFRGSFQPPDAVAGDAFGSSVSVALSAAGTQWVVTVGAPKADVAVGTTPRVDAGKVYVLTRAFGATGAVLANTRTAFAPATGDEFGYSAASVPGFGIIGTPFNDAAGLNKGMARTLIAP
jgi:hypothetical protein